MNILFITLYDIKSINNRGIYEDLLREFDKHKHHVYIVSPIERKFREDTHIIKEHNCRILKVRTGNIQKTNIIEKGMATILLEPQFVMAIKKYYKKVKFDLVLYSTPPITVAKSVEYIKKRDGAKTYLLLKDIFPQNAVDIGIMSKHGLKEIIYKFFRLKEKKLYRISDFIGCMSEANCQYIIQNNPELDPRKVEVCPNCIEIKDVSLTDKEYVEIRKKYGIPLDKKIFVYGGNLGKPQGVSFIIECLKSQLKKEEVYFLIVGDGTEFNKLRSFFNKYKPRNMKLLQKLPKDDFDKMIAACDVGMIFLDHRFTIPNFPSRLLSYMQAGIPVLACTDTNTDIGKVIVDGGFGWWCESDSVKVFCEKIQEACKCDLVAMGENAFRYLEENYTAEKSYGIINKIF